MAMTRGRPVIARGLDPSGRRGNPDRSASRRSPASSRAADRDRAAASGSRRGDRAHDRSLRPQAGPALARGACRPPRPTSMSPTPWANSGCSTGSRRSCSWADRWSSMAGRIRSRRSSSAPSVVHGPHVFNFTDVYEALDAAGGARRADTQEALVKQFGQLLADADGARSRAGRRPARGRSARRRARSHAVGARALSAAIADRDGSRQCVSRASGTGPSSLNAHLLKPLGALYGAIAARRMRRKGIDAGIPVLCVGNYHVGGAGKTPTVLALAKLLRELGETPVVLSRGYGGTLHGPVRVDPARHAAADVGDEPLMMARDVPVVVARDRVGRRRRWRASQGATVILMDDGFQNPAIVKDASLIVIDSERGARQWPGISRRPPARAAAAATRAHRRAGPHRRRPCRRGRSRPRSPRRASRCCGASEAGRGVGRAASRQARAGLCRHRRSRAVLQHAARQRHRGRARARPLPIITRFRASRDRSLVAEAKRDGS